MAANRRTLPRRAQLMDLWPAKMLLIEAKQEEN
jgi:hypothetical protein